MFFQQPFMASFSTACCCYSPLHLPPFPALWHNFRTFYLQRFKNSTPCKRSFPIYGSIHKPKKLRHFTRRYSCNQLLWVAVKYFIPATGWCFGGWFQNQGYTCLLPAQQCWHQKLHLHRALISPRGSQKLREAPCKEGRSFLCRCPNQLAGACSFSVRRE